MIGGLKKLSPMLEAFDAEQRLKLLEGKCIDAFAVGDTVDVEVNIIENGVFVRTQSFKGICIAKTKKKGLHANFIVRRVSQGDGVEKCFNLCSPLVKSIKLLRRGRVRRAKLYYLRQRKGRAAKVGEPKHIAST